ncbi:rod shape-determining protein MreC [Hydrogenophilus hirschii]
MTVADSAATHLSFRRSLPLTTRAWLATLVAIAVMVADARFDWLTPLRDGVSVLVRPLVAAGQWPFRVWEMLERTTIDVVALQQENAELRRQLLILSAQIWEGAAARRENDRLRALLGFAPMPGTRLLPAQVLYDSPDPFSRRIVIDRGSNHGIRPGLAVAAAKGLVGQVTRVQPLVSEVTLITHERMRIPATVARTGMRGILWGRGEAELQLRDVLGEWAVAEGDEVVTSGLDGLYPVGLPVGRVTRIEREQAEPLVFVTPFEAGAQWRQLLVLVRDETVAP